MLKQINDILMEMAFLDEPPDYEDTLKEDLGIDSLRMVELIVSLEDCFDITLDESDLNPANMKTVRDIFTLVNKYIGGENNV